MNLCKRCTGLCCRYIALPIETPSGKNEFDDIRWYLSHKGVSVFVEKKDWYISFATPCRNLMKDNRCGIYEQRPKICRGYKNADCDFTGGEYDYELHFTKLDQFEEWLRNKKTGWRLKGAWRQPARRKPKVKLNTSKLKK